MKNTICRSLILGAAILTGMLLGSVAQADSIGIQFVGGGGSGGNNTPMDPSEVAGAVVRQANWNPALGSEGGAIHLVNQDGNLTGATLDYYSSTNTWSINIPDVPGDNRLMRGYLDTNNTSTTVVILSGIPYATYDVHIYANGDNGGEDRQGIYYVDTLDNHSPVLNPAGQTFNGTYILGQNYTLLSCTGEECLILANPDQNFGGGTKRAPLNGIQIVDTSGPDYASFAVPDIQIP